MRLERPSCAIAAIAAGITLAGALVVPLVEAVASGRGAPAVEASRTAGVVVAGVSLVVHSPSLPEAAFVASKPGALAPGCGRGDPGALPGVLDRAYSYGSPAPAEGIGVVDPQDLSAYRSTVPGVWFGPCSFRPRSSGTGSRALSVSSMSASVVATSRPRSCRG